MKTPIKKTVLQQELHNPAFFRACESRFNTRDLFEYKKRPPKTRKVLDRFAEISIEYFHKDRELLQEAYRLGSLVEQ